MKSHKLFSLVLLICFCQSSANAQREFGVCDSTEHFLNNDTTIVAGRNHLYISTQAGISLIHDFTQTDTNYYIRDFDVIDSELWLTVVGSRYIGGPTTLYKSIDRGMNWQVDSSFYSVTRMIDSTNYYNSINQVYKLGTDTILLFLGYYFSGIAYSIDGGVTWNNWFQNLIAHYHGIFQCDSLYYIFGIEGDAFPSSMFAFNRTNIFRNDSVINFNHFSPTSMHPPCYNGPHPDCIHGYSVSGRCDQYLFFKNYIDSICALPADISETDNNLSATVFTNPADNSISLKLPSGVNEMWKIDFYDLKGRLYFSQHRMFYEGNQNINIPVGQLPEGMYLITIQSDKYRFNKKIIIRD